MRFRKFRIAWSGACAIASVLLIALWVHSYWWWTAVGYQLNPNLGVAAHAFKGKVMFLTDKFPSGEWGFHQSFIDENKLPGWRFPTARGAFDYTSDKYGAKLFIPFWAVAPLPAIFIPVAWMSSRFSLRTMLIATTLVAAVLGLAVYIARN